jgi:farnesyl diphosphate synthase/geranylgeranyl diphosphate synthase type II
MEVYNYKQRVEKKLDSYLPISGELADSMRYSAIDCGKRFRPILTYTIADIFKEDFSLFDSSAVAVELIHAYSLIHDDLPAMDDDDVRHSKPACHKKYTEAQAILTGDALQALAFEIISNDIKLESNTRLNCIQLLTRASYDMALGQAIDMSISSKKVDLNILENMHNMKTGSLLRCSVNLGGTIATKCNSKDQEILDSFAKLIGLAYQIQDDVLELIVSEDVLGKKQNSDIEKNKTTYPSLMGLDKSKKMFNDYYDTAITSIEELSVDGTKLINLTKQLQSRGF